MGRDCNSVSFYLYITRIIIDGGPSIFSDSGGVWDKKFRNSGDGDLSIRFGLWYVLVDYCAYNLVSHHLHVAFGPLVRIDGYMRVSHIHGVLRSLLL